MKSLRVVHLVYYGYEKTVIDSQVVAPARRLAADGIDVELVFLEDPFSWLLGRWRRKKAALTAAGLRSHFLPRAPRNFLGLNSRNLSALFSTFLDGASPLVVHARGFQGADALLSFKAQEPQVKLICDARGIEWAEYELDIGARHGRPLNAVESAWKRSLEEIERRAVATSDVLLCVSRAMIPFLIERAGRAVPADYVPCAVDVEEFSKGLERREETRRELKVGAGPLIVYAGSMSVWQLSEESAKVAARAMSIDPTAHFLIVTPTPGLFKSLALRAGVPGDRLRVVNVDHADVPRFLAAGDLALLLRAEGVVNRYACPTKFAEYLACGLHVLATPAVDEVAGTIRETGCGTLLPAVEGDSDTDRVLRSALMAAGNVEQRTRLSLAAARARYDWALHLGTLKKWYRQLASNPSHPT